MKGFTLLELLVVLVLVGILSGAAVLALPDRHGQRLEREAQRLVAWLEAGRAHSRATGQPIGWQAQEGGFAFSAHLPPVQWLYPDTRVHLPASATGLVLGPEPLIPAQTLTLALGGLSLKVGTDGFGPFVVAGGHEAP
jgi:general secretion pathway protein H